MMTCCLPLARQIFLYWITCSKNIFQYFLVTAEVRNSGFSEMKQTRL
jgi:hypothetical protein